MRNIFLFSLALIFSLSTVNAQWQQTSLDSVYVNAMAVSGTNIFVGTNGYGNLYVSNNNGNNWSVINNGLPSGVIVSSLAISGTNIFAGTSNFGIYLSTNNGLNWNAVNTGLTNYLIYCLGINSSTIFAGTVSVYGGGVFSSSNNGANWYASGSGLPAGTGVLALTSNGSTVFAGIRGVYRSNNGSNWSAASNGLPLYNGIYPHIYSFAINGSSIFSGTESGIYLSNNNGSNWTALDTNIVAISFVISGSKILAGTAHGVYLSINNGASWTVAGLTNYSVSSLVICGNEIFAGTKGAGVWKISLNGLNIEELIKNNSISICPNPANNNLTIETPPESEIEILNMQGKLIRTLAASGTKTDLDVSALPSGIYLVKVKTEKGIAVKKFIKE